MPVPGDWLARWYYARHPRAGRGLLLPAAIDHNVSEL